MNREDILGKVTALLDEVLDGLEVEITETTTSKDVEDWDSVTNIEIISEIEDQFKISFSIPEIEELNDVGDIITLIKNKLV